MELDIEKVGAESPDETKDKRHSWAPIAVFLAQVTIVYSIIITALYNLTYNPESYREAWLAILGTCVGYLVPNPSLHRK